MTYIPATLDNRKTASQTTRSFPLYDQQAGGARDDRWTGTNEDASESSVIPREDALLTYLHSRIKWVVMC